MTTITVKNLVLQFDSTSNKSSKEQAQEAIDLINLSLQREPHGLGAQILSSGLDDSDIEDVKVEE